MLFDMGMPALHFYCPVAGFDAHWVYMSGVPTTVPNIFLGILFDIWDYLPPNCIHVRIHGLPRANAGTAGVGNHVPIFKFVKNPADQAEVMLGSSTVEAEGDPLAYGPLPAFSCSDFGSKGRSGKFRKLTGRSPMLPTSIVIPIPFAPHVNVGGSPTVSASDMAKQYKRPGTQRFCRLLRKAKSGRFLVRKLPDIEANWALVEQLGEDWNPMW